jgi:hypothetical protein
MSTPSSASDSRVERFRGCVQGLAQGLPDSGPHRQALQPKLLRATLDRTLPDSDRFWASAILLYLAGESAPAVLDNLLESRMPTRRLASVIRRPSWC